MCTRARRRRRYTARRPLRSRRRRPGTAPGSTSRSSNSVLSAMHGSWSAATLSSVETSSVATQAVMEVMRAMRAMRMGRLVERIDGPGPCCSSPRIPEGFRGQRAGSARCGSSRRRAAPRIAMTRTGSSRLCAAASSRQRDPEATRSRRTRSDHPERQALDRAAEVAQAIAGVERVGDVVRSCRRRICERVERAD